MRTFFSIVIMLVSLGAGAQETISLNGQWLMGEGRNYVETVTVPGIHTDPTWMNNDTLWYKRTVTLPRGRWTHATLELKGARFAPAVFVDGVEVSRSGGGMAPTFHLLKGRHVKPGKTVTIEIALTSLKQLPKTDASYIAVSDHWRSNISSSLWDDVFRATVPTNVSKARIYTPVDETELRTMLAQQDLIISEKPEQADVILLSALSWNRIAKGDSIVNWIIEQAINRGISVVMLDVGPQSLGKGYPIEGQSLKSLLNPPSVSNPRLQDYRLFGSIIFHFKEAAEAETNLFPDVKNNSLWKRLPADYRGMWNGLRGDLVVPAWEMEVQGVNADLDNTGKSFERRYDETAVQMVLNMIEQVLTSHE